MRYKFASQFALFYSYYLTHKQFRPVCKKNIHQENVIMCFKSFFSLKTRNFSLQVNSCDSFSDRLSVIGSSVWPPAI